MKFIYPYITQLFKRLKLILFCLIIFFIYEKNLYSQQFNNWYFKVNNGLTFNTNSPSFLSGSPFGINTNTFSCATISDKNGDILFSSDGIKVWDKNNNQMPNGFGLLGDNCNINGVLIIPFIDDENRYYILTAKGLNNYFPNYQSTLQYCYSIVDMSLNNGLGDVVNKNTFIRNYSTEKMVAIPNANGKDIWWICRDWTNHFYSYKITCAGFINSNPVISTVGENLNEDRTLLGAADIKASGNGKYIAVAYNNYFEIYLFDKLTGILSNPIKIPVFASYGVEFSPDSRFLYISAQGFPDLNTPSGILQFDLSNYDSASIYNSAVNLNDRYGNFITSTACLQLGPDGKIYIGSLGPSHLAAINFPNNLGNAAFLQDSVILMPNQVLWRLPYSYVNLIANQNVQINYTVAPDCRTVTLNAKTYIKGNNLAFNWKFGDGDSSIQNVMSGGDTTYTTIIHTYPPGEDTFNVSLTVTSDTVCGLGRAGAKVVVKPPPPTAKFGSNAICDSLTIQFADSTLLNFNPSITYQWAFKRTAATTSFTDFSTAKNPAFTFAAFDSFCVRLIATSPLACVASDTIINTIRLKPKPTAAFTTAGSCGNKTVAFTNSSTVAVDTLSSYHWQFGSEGSSAVKNPSFTFNNFGSYPIKLSVTSSLGCVSDTFRRAVAVADKPEANILYNNNACANTSFNLTSNTSVQVGTINSYNWVLQDVPAGNTASINPVLAAGNYTVKHWVSSSSGCNSDTAQQLIPVQANPIVSINAPDGCVGTTIPFGATISAGDATTYKWLFGNGDSSSLGTPNYTYLQPGNYAISYTATSSNGCKSNVVVKNISIETNPVVSFITDELCAGKRINFTSTATNIAGNITRYNWTFGNDSTAVLPVGITTFNRPGTYSVTHTASTTNGCSTSAMQNIIIPNLPLNAGNDVTINQNTPYQLQGSGTGNFLWQPVQFLNNATIANPVAILQKDQLFALQLTTSNGCKGFDSVLIKVLSNIFIPSAFSPNGDTNNDTWRIQRLAEYTSAKLSVFNRYGQLIFEGSNNNGYAWDGKYKGKLQPTGAYVYVLLINDGKANKTFKGTVMLVR